jgi:hypothetical protein
MTDGERFADALAHDATIAPVNERIAKYGFKFENGGFVPVGAVRSYPVSTRVTLVENDDAECTAPVELEAPEQGNCGPETGWPH